MNKTFEKELSMPKVAKLTLDGGDLELPVIVGTENEKAVDISKLRAKTGYITSTKAT